MGLEKSNSNYLKFDWYVAGLGTAKMGERGPVEKSEIAGLDMGHVRGELLLHLRNYCPFR